MMETVAGLNGYWYLTTNERGYLKTVYRTGCGAASIPVAIPLAFDGWQMPLALADWRVQKPNGIKLCNLCDIISKRIGKNSGWFVQIHTYIFSVLPYLYCLDEDSLYEVRGERNITSLGFPFTDSEWSILFETAKHLKKATRSEILRFIRHAQQLRGMPPIQQNTRPRTPFVGVTSPQEIAEISHAWGKDTWRGLIEDSIPMGNTMYELRESTWINIHSFHITTVRLEMDRYCRYILKGNDLYTSDIGDWRNNRYVITHWIRIDHLTVEQQLEWYKAWIIESSTHPMRSPWLAVNAIQLFCTQHNLPMPPIPDSVVPYLLPASQDLPTDDDDEEEYDEEYFRGLDVATNLCLDALDNLTKWSMDSSIPLGDLKQAVQDRYEDLCQICADYSSAIPIPPQVVKQTLAMHTPKPIQLALFTL